VDASSETRGYSRAFHAGRPGTGHWATAEASSSVLLVVICHEVDLGPPPPGDAIGLRRRHVRRRAGPTIIVDLGDVDLRRPAPRPARGELGRLRRLELGRGCGSSCRQRGSGSAIMLSVRVERHDWTPIPRRPVIVSPRPIALLVRSGDRTRPTSDNAPGREQQAAPADAANPECAPARRPGAHRLRRYAGQVGGNG